MNRVAHRMTKWIALTLGFSGAALAASDTSVPAAPESEQIYLEGEFLFVESAEIQAYLDGVIDKLLQGRTEKFTRPRLLLYSTPDFDARSDTLGNILVSTQTLRMLESEDELAALLGHELAHVVLNHPNKKSIIQSFPMGVESMNAIAAAGDEVVQAQRQKTVTPTESRFARKSSIGTQNFSEFWSDLLATNWNRKQEREADRVGFDMMRAAGYDPSAFATLFSKLHAAQLKRGERMEVLRKKMIARAQKPQIKTSAAAGSTEGEINQVLNDVGDVVSTKAVDAVFDGVAKGTADYDSPEQRQELLAKYAAEKPAPRRDKTPRSVKFAQTLREGAGGALLASDSEAQRLMAALQTGDEKTATEAAASLVPKGAAVSGKQKTAAPSKKKKDGQDKSGAAQAAKVASPASPHLNLAMAQWFEHTGKNNLADQRLADWLSYPRAPALAFVQHAGYQAERGDYESATATLENGSRRLATPKPFLPTHVSVAKAANNMTSAQAYVQRCKDEDTKSMSAAKKILAVFKSNPVPTGLYAECLARLNGPTVQTAAAVAGAAP